MMMIGQLAELASVAPSAIRFYEREGLIEPMKIGRCRTYTSYDVEVLKSIVRLRKIGLPISKIREALAVSNSTDDNQGLNGFAKIIEQQIEELHKMSEVISDQLENAKLLLGELDGKLDQTKPPT